MGLSPKEIMEMDADEGMSEEQKNAHLIKVVIKALQDAEECVTIASEECEAYDTGASVFLLSALYSLGALVQHTQEMAELHEP